MKGDLIDCLRAMNRRERFLLLGWALARSTFQLGWEFREKLSTVLSESRVDVEIPADAFIAMDYPMLWMEVALDWAANQIAIDDEMPLSAQGAILTEHSFKSHQQDADLVVAFSTGPIYDVVFVEAKGVTNWDYPQLRSKIQRVDGMLRVYGESAGFRPHFVTVGPTQPDPMKAFDSYPPQWAVKADPPEFRHLPLPQPVGRRVLATRGYEGSSMWHLEVDPWPVANPHRVAAPPD
jgi:hypothetical protein